MTTLAEFWKQPFAHGMVDALGWTLLHFLWQGVLVAGLLWCVLALVGGRSARVRYGFACAALLLMAALPLTTFARLAAAEPRNALPVALPAFTLDVNADGAGDGREPLRERLARGLDAAAPWIPAIWAVGLVVFLGRLNYGLMVAGRLKASGTEPVSEELLEAFEVLKERLGVKSAVRMLQSAMVQVPTVIGWLRPIVLVPVGCFAGLSTMQVEALLAHELAHIRRNDYLVSVLQSVVEAMLFYHPAVWWVSRQVRRERECCCDELAVGVGGDALAYARALACLEESRAGMPEVVLSANGGVLTMRIKRLLGNKEDSVVSRATAFLILCAVVVVAGSYVAAAARAQSHRMAVIVGMHDEPLIATEVQGEIAAVPPVAPYQPGQHGNPVQSMKPQYRNWLDQDVVWIITPQERAAFLKLANDEERDAFITQFWARRDPPGAAANSYRETHYARIAYSNQHFAAVNAAGWKSDRGHVYIAYGKPDEIESHPSGGQGSAPYELWHYSSLPGFGDNVDIRFVDTCRCGDYRYTVDQPGHSGIGLDGSGGTEPKVILAAKILAAGSGSPSQAETVRSESAGVISGVVYDPTGALVPRAQVKATNAAANLVRGAVTDNAGNYSLMALPSGNYTVEVRAAGFASATRTNVSVEPGKAAGVNLKLRVGSVSQTLAVKGAPVAETAKAKGPVPPPPARTDGKPMRVSAGVMAGNAISQPAPVYPDDAKAAKVQGVVVLHAIISKAGTVDNVAVVSGPPALMVSAIDAVRQWKYKPYLLNGEPTAVETTININYTLADGNSTPGADRGLAPAQAPIKAAASAMEGNLIDKVQPDYPPIAKAAAVQGAVVLHAVISKEGNVEQLTVLSGPPMLTPSALDAVRQWKYRPYLLNGQPTEVETTITVNYSLPGSADIHSQSDVRKMPDGTVAPVLIYQVEPEYTQEAKAAKKTGTVLVNLIVNQKGMPTQVHVLKGVDAGLDKKAVDAVRQYRFKPAMKDDKAVDKELNVEVNFQVF